MSRLPNPHETPLLTVEEAAGILGISRATAYRRVEDGTLPVLRLGNRTTRIVTGALPLLLGGYRHRLPSAPQPRERATR